MNKIIRFDIEELINWIIFEKDFTGEHLGSIVDNALLEEEHDITRQELMELVIKELVSRKGLPGIIKEDYGIEWIAEDLLS